MYKTYSLLPIWLQNIAISIYGYRINRLQSGVHHKKLSGKIRNNVRFTEKEIAIFQNDRIKSLIKEAVQHVPYYRQLFKKNNIDVDDIQTVDDLKRVPVLEKELVRETPELFINERYRKRKLAAIYTSGTTGTPLKIFFDSFGRQLHYAFYNRFLEETGLSYYRKRATFGGRVIIASGRNKSPFWRYSYFQKNLLFSSFHVKDENILCYVKRLISWQPEYIEAYPSTIYEIARYCKKYNVDLNGVTKGIITSAECLFEKQREVIEAVFGVPIYDQYGSAEMSVFIAQCKKGSYHVHMDYGVVEFLKGNGTTAEAGEEAEVICTGFVNPVMPLIRYRIGDRAICSDKQCECGCSFQVVDKILGRIDDSIITPDGRKVSRFGAVLYGLPVRKAQYRQKAKESITVLIVKDYGYGVETEKKVMIELRRRLGDEVTIELKYVDDIPCGKGGKYKSVVSYVDEV